MTISKGNIMQEHETSVYFRNVFISTGTLGDFNF